jgi:hypothetical protein
MRSLLLPAFSLLLAWVLLSAAPALAQAAPDWDEQAPAALPDRGDIKVSYGPSKEEDLRFIRTLLIESDEFEVQSQELNAEFALPRDLLVTFAECGLENAYYDPKEKAITICYELLRLFAGAFVDETMSREEVRDEVVYAAIFFFYHELGHALVDLYKLPIVGRQEDVVDEFAALLLLDSYDDDAVLAALDQFDLLAEKRDDGTATDDLPLWDEHGLSAQRYYNIACFIYGADPDEYGDLVSSNDLPERRAAQCIAEVEQKFRSWDTLLDPYRK